MAHLEQISEDCKCMNYRVVPFVEFQTKHPRKVFFFKRLVRPTHGRRHCPPYDRTRLDCRRRGGGRAALTARPPRIRLVNLGPFGSGQHPTTFLMLKAMQARSRASAAVHPFSWTRPTLAASALSAGPLGPCGERVLLFKGFTLRMSMELEQRKVGLLKKALGSTETEMS